ncbi:MAG: fimbrial assembly protein, partial [Aquincola sp.]|nr:fimbrial assembly protein [Aquincola sp.]
MNRPLLVPTRARQRGAGALVAVVLLYVAMAIIVVFANRSLIFEQKTSANQYRATMALETAEAGVEWASTMLNKSGLINSTCTDSGSGFNFRDKYLDYVTSTGRWNLNGASGTVVAACEVPS